MREKASDLVHRLAHEAEAVCRRYLSNGHREGRYWLVGDARNTPGRSMFVRLSGSKSGKGAAGKWTDGATGERGDLLDVIRESCGLLNFKDVVDEARSFLSLPHFKSKLHSDPSWKPKAPSGSLETAKRLFAWRSLSKARSRNPIFTHVASRLCMEPDRCAFIRAATTGPTSTVRQRSGRQ